MKQPGFESDSSPRKENNTELSPLVRAGILLFAGVFHAGALYEYKHGPEQVEEAKEHLDSIAGDVSFALQDAEFSTKKVLNADLYDETSRTIQTALEHGEERNVDLSDFFFREEFFLEGLSSYKLHDGEREYLALIETLKKEKADGATPKEVLDHLLAEGGEQDDEQASMYQLLTTGKGSCVARAKLFSAAVEDVYPEWKKEDTVLENFGGYTDNAGEEHAGHVQLALTNNQGERVVFDGDTVQFAPITEDTVVRVQAHREFIIGTAAAMDLLPGSSEADGWDEYGGKASKKRGMIFPPSPAIHEGGDASGEAQGATSSSGSPSEKKEEEDRPVGLQSFRKILPDSVVDAHTAERAEYFKVYRELKKELDGLIAQHASEGMQYLPHTSQLTLLLPALLPSEDIAHVASILKRIDEDGKGERPYYYIGISDPKTSRADTIRRFKESGLQYVYFTVYLNTPSLEQIKELRSEGSMYSDAKLIIDFLADFIPNGIPPGLLDGSSTRILGKCDQSCLERWYAQGLRQQKFHELRFYLDADENIVIPPFESQSIDLLTHQSLQRIVFERPPQSLDIVMEGSVAPQIEYRYPKGTQKEVANIVVGIAYDSPAVSVTIPAEAFRSNRPEGPMINYDFFREEMKVDAGAFIGQDIAQLGFQFSRKITIDPEAFSATHVEKMGFSLYEFTETTNGVEYYIPLDGWFSVPQDLFLATQPSILGLAGMTKNDNRISPFPQRYTLEQLSLLQIALPSQTTLLPDTYRAYPWDVFDEVGNRK